MQYNLPVSVTSLHVEFSIKENGQRDMPFLEGRGNEKADLAEVKTG